MDWERDHPTWPLHHLSRRIDQRTHRWHVQESGEGKTLLLLHGAGASTHSWRDVIPLLAQSYHVIAVDLPGQGFTRVSRKTRCGLPAMTEDIAALCVSQNWTPHAVIGHSAGAAIALNIAARLPAPDGRLPAIVGINAALGRFEGIAGWLFPLLAKVLALNPLTSYAFAAGRSNPSRARRLIEGTGSTLTDDGIELYARLISDRNHVEGTLQMMAQWNVDSLLDDLGEIQSPCLFVVGEKDRAVKPVISERAAAAMPHARITRMPSAGHMAHEEKPQEITDIILTWLAEQQSMPDREAES